ncbi:MAG TPA: TolC family protein, partial [Minicystis sp.]|nr:TolC family protein [Minicystis sp.]
KAAPVAATPFSFALPVDNYAFTGSVSLPVSDYVFRLVQGYTAASHVVKARQLSADAEALQVAADGRVAFYNWVRAKGQTVVAKESVDAARAHVVDAKHAFDVGYISKADVLRLEAQVASAEQLEAQAEAFESVAAEQLRTVMAAPPGRPLALGVDVLGAPTPLPDEDLATLDEQALKQRLEIRALDETIASLKQVENVTAAGYLPRVDAFADGMYANPNPRVFPPASKWDFTWDLGVRASWTLNDTFSTLAATSEARAQTRAAIEQRAQIRDALRLEVANAASDARQAQASLAAAERGLAAAEESLRVRRELFKNGKATSVDLVDAETEATRARLARLDAHVGLLAAKARLDHATGRDARQLRPAAP